VVSALHLGTIRRRGAEIWKFTIRTLCGTPCAWDVVCGSVPACAWDVVCGSVPAVLGVSFCLLASGYEVLDFCGRHCAQHAQVFQPILLFLQLRVVLRSFSSSGPWRRVCAICLG
jgi:hypothetical protein